MQGSTQSLLRGPLERAQNIFSDFVISRQVLRVEEPLQTNRNQYKFQLKQGNSSTDGPLENLLNDSDAFVIVGVRIYIKKQDLTLDPAEFGNYELFSYPNKTEFDGTDGTNFEWRALMTIWNGKLSFRTGSLERMKPTDTNEYLFAPAEQDVGDNVSQFGGFSELNRGYVEQQPTLLLDGSQNNEFQLDLGSGSLDLIDGNEGGETPPTTRNVVGLMILGLNIANGAESAKRFAKSWGGQ